MRINSSNSVLLVSAYPYTQTGRGMDVLTNVFEIQGWDTTHLIFPNVLYTIKKKIKFDSVVRELLSRFAVIPYLDRLMYWFPKQLFYLYLKYAVSKVDFIDWLKYNYVILESGKPLFLLDVIPESVKIIYRQSDSVRLVLGKGKWYIDLEDRVCQRAERIITVKDYYRNNLPLSSRDKAVTIRNGFSIPEEKIYINPYIERTKNVVYVGLTPLDPKTLDLLCKENKNIEFHIFGSCLKIWQHRRLSINTNFHFYGFCPRDEYLPYLAYADAAIFPFKYFPGMDHVGFTSKYLNFMYFKLPIVSYLTGNRDEFSPYPIHLPQSPEDFSSRLRVAIAEGPVDYDIDFDFFSHKGRKKEYSQFINMLS